MKLKKENDQFDTWLEASDWRYSAAIVGLSAFLDFFEDEIEYELSDDDLKFNKADITEERYLEFAENFFKDQFKHKDLEQYMCLDEWTEEQIKEINELLRGNSIMKKVFGKIKFDGTNQEEIQELIEANRKELIQETFRNKSNLYKNFINPGQLFKEPGTCCRLWGYYVDGGRKTKSLAYNFDVNTFVSQDDKLFDFIPFAFWGDREVFFVNANYSLRELVSINKGLKYRIGKELETSKINIARKTLFKTIQETSDFLNYGAEVIVKQQDNEFFETMYIRRESIKVLQKIRVYEPFCFSVKVTDNYYLDVQRKVTECILNMIRTDELIELFLKQDIRRGAKSDNEYLISLFIQMNTLICGGGEKLKQSMGKAYSCAKTVAKKLPENKRKSYRQKLTSAIIFKDYDRCCEILLQLSNQKEINMEFKFMYDLFEDFEKNKDIVYTFISALSVEPEKERNEKGGNEE